jgi:hypothetical protein
LRTSLFRRAAAGTPLLQRLRAPDQRVGQVHPGLRAGKCRGDIRGSVLRVYAFVSVLVLGT